MKLLITVEDTFAITGRGTILAPEVDLGPRTATVEMTIELRRPDGSRETCPARGQVVMQSPPRFDAKHAIIIQLPKTAVPIGTEVWLVDEVPVRRV